jgi:drug/metabolite transporter (DMT)-like permease
MDRMSKLRVDHYRAVGALVGTAVLLSLAGVLFKQVEAGAIAIAGIRSAIAFLFLMLFVRKRDLTFSGVQIAGAVFYALTMLIFVGATKLTTAANAIVLQYTAPVYVAILGHCFLKERTTFWEWVTVVGAVAGVGLFFLDEFSVSGVWGNVLGIGTGVTFALSIFCFRMQKDGSPIGSMFLGNAITAVVAAPFVVQSMPTGGVTWGILVLLGVVQLGLPYVLYAWAIKRVTALEGIMIPVIEPILNPLWVGLFVGELPGKWAVPGGILVISAAVGCAIIRMFRAKE